MVMKNGLRYFAESAATATMIVKCLGWVFFATFSYLLELRRYQRRFEDPYWAEDGDSENIPALKH